MKIVSFDVGHTNLAMVVVHAEFDNLTCTVEELEVVHAEMFDLAAIRCPHPEECIFMATDKCAAHKCHHLVDIIHPHLEGSDLVLAERQPLCGLTGIEQSLYIYIKQRYSGDRKTHMRLVSPNSVHAHFCMSSEKVDRRLQVVEIAKDFLEECPAFIKAREKDHLADAFAFVLFFCQAVLPREMVSKRTNPFSHFAMDVDKP